MNKKSLAIVSLFLVTAMSLTGCFGSIEVNEIALISGATFSKEQATDKYLVSVEIINKNKTSKKDDEKYSQVISYTGETLSDAILKCSYADNREAYWDYSLIMVVDKDLAKNEGIAGILDFIVRNYESRVSVVLFIGENDSAENFIHEGIDSNISAIDIFQMIMSNKLFGITQPVYAFEASNRIAQPGIEAVLPTLKMVHVGDDKCSVQTQGLAVLKGFNLVGFLDIDQTKTYLMLMNNTEHPHKTVDYDFGEPRNMDSNIIKKDKVTYQVAKMSTDRKIDIVNGKAVLNIHLNGKVIINEHKYDNRLSTEEQDKIEEYIENQLVNECYELISYVRRNYASDIFGFGKQVKKKAKKEWEIYGDDWNDTGFLSLPISITSEIRIVKNRGVF